MEGVEKSSVGRVEVITNNIISGFGSMNPRFVMSDCLETDAILGTVTFFVPVASSKQCLNFAVSMTFPKIGGKRRASVRRNSLMGGSTLIGVEDNSSEESVKTPAQSVGTPEVANLRATGIGTTSKLSDFRIVDELSPTWRVLYVKQSAERSDSWMFSPRDLLTDYVWGRDRKSVV